MILEWIITARTPGNIEGAKKSLKWLIKLNRSKIDIDNVILEENIEKTAEPSFIDTMKDFWRYK